MSWKASSFVLDLADRTTESDLSPTELFVLLALAARHNDRDYHCAYGQLDRMAKDTHLHVVTLSKVLTRLEDKGYVTVWEGQLPRRKSDPVDGRRTRGTMWCFVGLDFDDGPNIAGATPRARAGGRPKTELAQDKLISEGSVSRDGGDELAGGEVKTGDELAGSNSPLLTGYQPAVETNGTGHSPSCSPPEREDGEAMRRVVLDLQTAGVEGSDARTFHDSVEDFLRHRGFDVRREHQIADRRDGRRGFIDLFARRADGSIALELDRQAPRQKSVDKLRRTDATCRAIVLRGDWLDEPPDGIDLVVGLSVDDPLPMRGRGRKRDGPRSRDRPERTERALVWNSPEDLALLDGVT